MGRSRQGSEGLPQELGALEVADENLELAAAGLEVARMLQSSILIPYRPQSSYRRDGSFIEISEQERIDQIAKQMVAAGCSPQEIGAFVARETGFEGC